MKDKKGLMMIVSGIVGWIVWIAGFVTLDSNAVALAILTTGVIPFLLGLTAVGLGVRSIMKKEKKLISVIIALLIGVPLVICSGFLLFVWIYTGITGGVPAIREAIEAAIKGGEEAIEARQESLGR